MRKLGKVYGIDKVLWTEMLSAGLTWACSRRPKKEIQQWVAVAESAQGDDASRREASAVIASDKETMPEYWYRTGREEGKELGIQEGRQEGRQEGELKAARSLLLRLGRRLLGIPDAATVEAVEALNDVERLETLCEEVSNYRDWSALLASAKEPQHS